MASSPFRDRRKAKPTKQHRPAVWECMLGTVYAANDAGTTRYFDYDWAGALSYAGVEEEGRDPRLARADRNYAGDGPRKGRWVLFVRKA